MARYVDGFVLPVPKRNIDAYRRQARKAGKIWREHGALEYRECVAEDVKKGEVTSFPQSGLEQRLASGSRRLLSSHPGAS